MEQEFKPLNENDFNSPEEFAAFNAAKESFIQQNKNFDFDTVKRLKEPDNNIEWPPVLQMINAAKNDYMGARMAAELIHADLPDNAKVALGKEYLLPKPQDRHGEPKSKRSNIPSFETMVILLKSGQNATNRKDLPELLSKSNTTVLREQLNTDIPSMSVEDHKIILDIEKKHNAGSILSGASKSVLTSQLSDNLVNAHSPEYLNRAGVNIHSLAEVTRDYAGIANSLEHRLRDLPNAWRDEDVKLNNEKKKSYQSLLRNGLEYNSRPPLGNTPAEQKEDLGKKIQAMLDVTNAAYDNTVISPKEIFDAFGKWKQHQTAMQVGKDYGSYEIGRIMEKFGTIVDNNISSRNISRLDGITALMDMRIVHPEQNGVSIEYEIPKIAEKANDAEALQIYDVFQQKSQVLNAANKKEGFSSWQLIQDAQKRIAQNNSESQPEMMDAMIGLSKMKIRNESKPTLNSSVTGLFKTLPVDGQKMLLSKMLNQGFPEAGSEELKSLIAIAKKSNDPEFVQGSYLLATKTYMKDIQAAGKPDATYEEKTTAEYSSRYMADMYRDAASSKDHKIVRGMIREQGAAAGMDNAKVGEVLKSVRSNYKSSKSRLGRAFDTVGSFFQNAANMTGLMERGAPKPGQKLTA